MGEKLNSGRSSVVIIRYGKGIIADAFWLVGEMHSDEILRGV
jgi:hypothetical protein